MADEMLTSEVIREADWTVLAFAGRLDRVTSPKIVNQAEALLAESAKLAIDLKKLSYLSSAGIRVLLRLARKAHAGKKPFAICGADGFVKEVIEDSNMNAIVPVCNDRSELGQLGTDA